MTYKVNDTVRIVVEDNCGYGKGHIGKITDICDWCYEVDGHYEYAESEIELVKPLSSRGFQRIQGYPDIPLPARGTKLSAGYDIASIADITIEPNATVTIPTGIKAYMADDEFLGLYVRSSIGKLGLSMVTGVSVIDSDYYDNPDNEGHIFVMLRNDTRAVIEIQVGQRLVQGIFQKYLVADGDNVTTERQGGTGSTTRLSKDVPLENKVSQC